MKKGLLIITANYYPKESSIANCIIPLIKHLMENGYEVDILTDRHSVEVVNDEIIDNVRVHRVNNSYNITKDILSHVSKDKALVKYCILKIFYFFKYRFLQPAYRPPRRHKKDVVNKALALYDEQPFDAILSISHPFKSHLLAKEIRKRLNYSVKWFVYEFDPFAYGTELNINKCHELQAFRDEYMVFEQCDALFLTPELYEFYKDTSFEYFIDKATSVNYTNLHPLEYDEYVGSDVKFNEEKINCLFLGKVYNNVRNPSFVLNVFSKLKSNIHFTLLTNTDEVDFSEYNINDDNITLIPFQPRNVALYAIGQTDILVNIGNTVLGQIPGKIFEYMGSGKPIIHFSKIKKDPSLVYLNKYPHALVINELEDSVDSAQRKIQAFCEKYSNTVLSFEDVSQSLGDYSGNVASETFTNIINNLLDGIPS